MGTFCHEVCKNSWNDWFHVWIVDSGGPEEAQVRLYLPGGPNVPTWEGTLAPLGEYDKYAVSWHHSTMTGEYDGTAQLRRRCGLMSDHFDHLFYLLILLKHLSQANAQSSLSVEPLWVCEPYLLRGAVLIIFLSDCLSVAANDYWKVLYEF